MLKPGDMAPDIPEINELRGKRVVLYFYPKADTPGCTIESCEFRDHAKEFAKKGVTVVGISPDKPVAQEKFKAKYDLPFALGSDEKGDVTEKYGVWVEKSMYGRKYMGIERSTFLIDGEGVIRGAWRKVKVDGHTDEVLKAAKSL